MCPELSDSVYFSQWAVGKRKNLRFFKLGSPECQTICFKFTHIYLSVPLHRRHAEDEIH